MSSGVVSTASGSAVLSLAEVGTLVACHGCTTLAQRYTHVAGYSWKTNQYGLTIDTVTAFELVLPNGTVKKVTERDEDLWFALRVRPNSVSEYYGHLSHSGLKGRIQQLREFDERLSREH
jgi:hypothetical protein